MYIHYRTRRSGRFEPPRLQLFRVFRTAPAHILDQGAASVVQLLQARSLTPLARDGATLRGGLKVMGIVCRERLERFPSRAVGDETATVARTATAALAGGSRGRGPLASLDMFLALRSHL